MKNIKSIYKVILLVLLFNTSISFAQQPVTINQSPAITTIVKAKTELDKTNKVSKYKIQLANGSKAYIERTLGRFYAKFPSISTSKVYESPEYKVRVGNYNTKLEAERALIRIRKEFPNAIILKL